MSISDSDGDDRSLADEWQDDKRHRLLAHIGPDLLSGTRSGQRYFALVMDQPIAMFAMYIIGINAPISNPVLHGLFFYFVYLAYFSVTEAIFGRTFGKWYFGLKVVTSSGNRIGWRQSIVRALMMSIENNPILLGGLPAALFVWFSRRRQRIGDMLAETVVVQV